MDLSKHLGIDFDITFIDLARGSLYYSDYAVRPGARYDLYTYISPWHKLFTIIYYYTPRSFGIIIRVCGPPFPAPDNTTYTTLCTKLSYITPN